MKRDVNSALPGFEFKHSLLSILGLVFGAVMAIAPSGASAATDAETVAALDTQYQAAVAQGDAATMDKILADDFVLVLGNGTIGTKEELIKDAQTKRIVYEQQKEVDNSQKVRVWGDTAVVTAKLWIKGSMEGKPFDRKLWFSDTYVRTKTGWRYVFGQASLALPSE